MQDSIRVIQPGGRRIKIFIDFWNVTINARSQTSDRFDLDVIWNALTSAIVGETAGGHGDDTQGTLAGCYIFGSYSPGNAKETKFKDHVLDTYASSSGLFFDFKERVTKETSHKCKQCGTPVQRSSESGVDIALTVEMIKHANMRDHEYLALVSSDRDFIPLLNYLKDQGQRVLHISPGHAHRDMRAASWKQVSLQPRFYGFTKALQTERILLTHPEVADQRDEAKAIFESAQVPYVEIDVTDKDQISDKDLEFLVRNLMMLFKIRGEHYANSFGIGHRIKNVYELRQGLKSGQIESIFPYII